MNWNRAEEVNFPWKRASSNLMYLAKSHCQWMGGCSISHNCQVLGGTHLHSGGTLSHGRCFWTHSACGTVLLGAWDTQKSKAQCLGFTVRLGQYSHKKNSFNSMEVWWGGMEKSERSFNVQVSNDRLHYCFYRKDCWFPSSLFHILSSVLFQIMIL